MINKAIAIIQARLSSVRLPGKVLKPLAGKPLIWHVYHRALESKFVDKVIIATSNESSDDQLANYCDSNKMNYYRGSLNNALNRFISILNAHPEFKYFVRITGDCPLIHPPFIDNQILALNKFDGDHIWIKNIGNSLQGQGVHSTRSLHFIEKNSTDDKDKEHVGAIYLVHHPDQFRVVEIINLPKNILSNTRLTIDEEADYLLFKKLFDTLWNKDKGISLEQAIRWLDQHPEIRILNKEVQHSEINKQVRDLYNRWEKVKKTGKVSYRI